MREDFLVPTQQRPAVLVIADPSGISLSLVEQLISSFCSVKIISDKASFWGQSLSHLGRGADVKTFSFSEQDLLGAFGQAIFVSSLIEGGALLAKERERLGFLENHLKKDSLEALLVVPGVIFSKKQEEFLESVRNTLKNNQGTVGVTYLGEVLGPRVSFVPESFLGKSLASNLNKPKITIPNTETRTVNVALAAREIIKLLFSFGGIGEETFLYSHQIEGSTVKDLLLSLGSKEVSVVRAQDAETPNLVSAKRQKVLTSSLLKDFEDTAIWLRNHPPETKVEKKPSKKSKPKPRNREVLIEKTKKEHPTVKKQAFSKRYLFAVFLLLFFLLSPFLLIFTGSTAFYLAAKGVKANNFRVAKTASTLSGAFANASSKELRLFSKIPLIGSMFDQTITVSNLLSKGSEVLGRAILLNELASELARGVLGEDEYDLTALSRRLSLEFASLYKETGFIESEIDQKSGIIGWFSQRLLEGRDLSEFRETLLVGEGVSNELPWLLGADGKRKYLVLFQNNMELRPTGGFIGSFAFVEVGDGKLGEIEVQDVYSADGQLKGHVEPPEPIKEYLGEANWYLRDSNWDPDFPVSAQRAEWFLDKEISVAVDGVVAIDLEVAKRLLEVAGSLKLENFGQEVTSSNLYEVTQFEAEEDFFPGSRKKATFLTALSRELLLVLKNIPKEKHSQLAKEGLGLLGTKHIQLFLHNSLVQKAITELTWDGAVYQPVCFDNCYADYFGMVEANVGVNKANYFIKRSAEFVAQLSAGNINRNLSITLTNSANPALGNKGRYKTYLRIIAPIESDFSDVLVRGPNIQEELTPEIISTSGRKEAGVLVEIMPGQKSTIVFNWRTPTTLSFLSNGEYRFVWRKQAGTLEDPVKIRIVAPELVAIKAGGLTAGHEAIYNTTLARDFSSRIFW